MLPRTSGQVSALQSRVNTFTLGSKLQMSTARGIVDITDLVLVAAVFGSEDGVQFANSRTIEMLTPTEVQQWLTSALEVTRTDLVFQRGIAGLARLLAVLTPKETALLPNYPNPFNPETWIPYQLAEPAEVTLRIYTVGWCHNSHLIRRTPASRYLQASAGCCLLGWEK